MLWPLMDLAVALFTTFDVHKSQHS